MDQPYLIAINSTTEWGIDRGDVLEALFGGELFSQVGGEGILSQNKHRRVSAVLVADAWPWALHQAWVEVFLNPWATTPLPVEALPFPRVVVEDNQFKVIRGQPLRTVVKLPDVWPSMKDE